MDDIIREREKKANILDAGTERALHQHTSEGGWRGAVPTTTVGLLSIFAVATDHSKVLLQYR